MEPEWVQIILLVKSAQVSIFRGMNSRNLIISSAIIFALIIIAGLVRLADLWGINQYGFMTIQHLIPPVILAGLGYYLMVTVAENNNPLARTLSKSQNLRIPILIVSLLLLAFLFYQFKSATYLWGDGYLRILETQNGMKIHFSEPLDKLLQYIFYSALNQSIGLSAIQSHQIVSILGGLLFFAITIYLACTIGSSPFENLLIGGLLLTSAAMQLFFGYVESYTISTPLFLLAVGRSYLDLKKGKSLFTGFALYLPACLFHMSLLAYWPAYFLTALLAYRHKKNNENRNSLILFGAGLIGLLVIAIILNRLQFAGKFDKNIFEFLLIPILPNAVGYWLFSPRHLLDMLNLILLTAPGAVIIAACCCDFKKSGQLSPAHKYLGWLVICGFLFLLLFRTSFGIGRDWDLFSSIAIPLNLFAAVLLIGKIRTIKTPNYKLIFLPVLISALIGFGFISANSNQQATVERYRKITDLTDYGKNLNLENLGEYYLTVNDYEDYCSVLRQATAVFRHPRYNFKIGMLYYDQGRMYEALKYFQYAYQIDSTYVPAVNYLGLVYGYLSEADQSNLKIAEQYFLRVVRLDPEYANAYFNLGHVYYNAGQYELAVQALHQAIIHEPGNYQAYQNLGYTYQKLEQADSAQYYFQIAAQKQK